MSTPFAKTMGTIAEKSSAKKRRGLLRLWGGKALAGIFRPSGKASRQKAGARLTWSFAPHSPAGKFATKR
jgi:hypothetical protein